MSLPLKLGFVMDPISRIILDKDTTFVLMLEAQARGHQNFYMELKELYVRDGIPYGDMAPVTVKRAREFYSLADRETRPLADLDVVMMRKDPPFTLDYIFSTYVLSLIPPNTFVMNDPKGLREANEKMYILNFPQAIPPTIVTKSIARAKAFLDEVGGEMILKPLFGAGGYSVFYTHNDDKNINALLELMTEEEGQFIMAQKYLPEIREGDKRIILLDGQPLGATLRVPKPDELRGNIHVGGECHKAELTERDLFLCQSIAPRLRQDGLYLVGLDVIGDYITEINVTSPTGIQEIDRLNNSCLEARVIDFVEEKVAETRCG
jgi:glutathione synthase